MRSLLSLFFSALIASASCGAAAESTMASPTSHLDVPADFQGIVIEGPAEVAFQKKTVSRPSWDRSGGGIVEYFGGLNIEGKVQIHTPVGKQYQTWFRFDKQLTFVVKDLTSNAIQKSSYVDGGWNLARQGVSVTMAPHPEESVSEAEFNTFLDDGKVISMHFIYELDDHLHTLYAEPTTLEIHAEYLDFRSNKIRVKVNVKND